MLVPEGADLAHEETPKARLPGLVAGVLNVIAVERDESDAPIGS
jgi:hypothetical protein